MIIRGGKLPFCLISGLCLLTAGIDRIYSLAGNKLFDKNSYWTNVPVGIDSIMKFNEGKTIFEKQWHLPLRPGRIFNDSSCASCHNDPVSGAGSAELNNAAVHSGLHLSDSNGSFYARYIVDSKKLVVKRRILAGSTLRRSPSLLGIGLLADVSQDDILKQVDSMDLDQDGISGKVYMEKGSAGRFGWKGRIISLEDFVLIALKHEMGIDTRTEITPAELSALLYFVRKLPPVANEANRTVMQQEGARLFTVIGCEACHRKKFTTIKGLTIEPYSDLLLHDMGKTLSEHFTEDGISGAEFRTPPLWGLGLRKTFLHNGTANNITGAIDAHGGEAGRSKSAWEKLSARDKNRLAGFLKSL
jgi:CxxC motif-containing protein (DUF1111 family)